MSESMKVQPHHLERGAYLYVRQSSMRQVIENVESTKRQYALRGRAIALGWREDQIVVVDSDQGESGASAAWREGFQHLVAEVSMGRAGIVMGLEVSRLARNNADWHRLLEICALADTLILDEDGVYDPANFNDRLLLGLKRNDERSGAARPESQAARRNPEQSAARRISLSAAHGLRLRRGWQRSARSRHTDPRHDRPLLRDVLARRLGVPDREGVSEGGPRLSIPAHRGAPRCSGR